MCDCIHAYIVQPDGEILIICIQMIDLESECALLISSRIKNAEMKTVHQCNWYLHMRS